MPGKYTTEGWIILPNSVGLRHKSVRKVLLIFSSLQERNESAIFGDVLTDLKKLFATGPHKPPHKLEDEF